MGQLCLASLADPDREPEVLVSDQNGAKQPYAWTRDGKSVIYWNADEWGASPWCDGIPLRTVDLESGRSRDLNLSSLVKEDLLELAPKGGNLLAVTAGTFRETWSGQRVAIMDLDAGIPQPLTPEDTAAVCPAWSPDSTLIACSAAPDANVAYRNSTMGTPYRVTLPNGTQETRMTASDSNFELDGYTAHPYLQQRKIWLLDPTGAIPPRRLTSDTRYRDEEPMWSADGGHMLFGRMDYDGNRSLWLMKANGEDAIRICELPTEEESWFGYYGYVDWRKCFDWRR
jgi:Tol biopolymer transport system component